MKKRSKAFTLVELIVVISILAILATIGFLALSGYSQDAKESAIKANVRSVQNAISAESALTGNSPRYYVIHDTGAALSGAFVYVDGTKLVLTGGDVGAPPADSNYTAGNPNYARLKINPDKFKVSFRSSANPAYAAYDSKFLSVGAVDWSAVSPSNGRTRTSSYFQVAGVDPNTKKAVVTGNFPMPNASETASGGSSWLVRDPNLWSTWSVVDGSVAGIVTATVTVQAGNPNVVGDDASGRKWSDGKFAQNCNKYLNPDSGYQYSGSTGSGTYWIDSDGVGGASEFKAYCDMSTDGGGWTLVGTTIDGNLISSANFTVATPYGDNYVKPLYGQGGTKLMYECGTSAQGTKGRVIYLGSWSWGSSFATLSATFSSVPTNNLTWAPDMIGYNSADSDSTWTNHVAWVHFPNFWTTAFASAGSCGGYFCSTRIAFTCDPQNNAFWSGDGTWFAWNSWTKYVRFFVK